MPVTITHISTWHPRTFTPFLIFSGLVQKGDWFADKLGDAPKVTYMHAQRNTMPETKASCGADAWCVLKSGSNSYEEKWGPLSAKDFPPCEAQFCSSLTFGNSTGPFQRYELYDGDKLWNVIQIRGAKHLALPPGRYEISDLDHRFENEYNSLEDYFPPRPAFRIKAITDSILSRL